MRPELVETTAALRDSIRQAKADGRRIGLVPTMGALHAGHASLIESARRETGFVVVSIFVNPTQFGPNEDFGRYPRALPEDIAICAASGADLIFHPSVEEIYPPGFRTNVEVTGLQDVLCGKSRPTHFRGVTTVVLKLFNLVQPDLAYFGQKDAQQTRIIQQMIHDLNLPIELRICPIVREPDGLALSSRNKYLTAAQRRQATVLFQALQTAKSLRGQGVTDAARLREAMIATIRSADEAVLDYAEIVDPETLQSRSQVDTEALALLAVKFGDTRLIDNLSISP